MVVFNNHEQQTKEACLEDAQCFYMEEGGAYICQRALMS
jgi:hypothetical protein